MKRDKARQRLDDAAAALAKAQNEYNRARIALQLNCKHKHVAEVPWRRDPYGYNHTPDHRICVRCGFAEWGWSCGYQILTNEPSVEHADRVGRIWPNHLFVVPNGTIKPRNKAEAYRMAVRGTLPQEYLDS